MRVKITLKPARGRARPAQTISAIKLLRDCGISLLEAKTAIETVIDFHFNERRGYWVEVPRLPPRFGHKLHDYGFILMGLES